MALAWALRDLGVSRLMRRFGFDETAQARNIFRNEMSLTGYRPLPMGVETEVRRNARPDLLRQWDKHVLPTKPGLISTYAINYHREFEETAANANLKLENDLLDLELGSLQRDVQLAGSLAKAMVQGRL